MSESVRRPPGEERDPTTLALFGAALLSPILGGGNVLLLFPPEEGALAWLVVALATSALVSASRPARGESSRARLLLTAVVVLWTLSFALREHGPRAPLDAVALATGGLLFVVLAGRRLGAADRSAVVHGAIAGAVLTLPYAQYQCFWVNPSLRPTLVAMGLPVVDAVNANFYSPNAYAAHLGAAVLLATIPLRGPSRGGRILAALVVAALGATIVETGSRSMLALVGLGVAGTMLVSEARSGRVVLAAGLAGASVAVGLELTGWLDLAELWERATLGRVAIWGAAVAMTTDHPLLGVGAGRFQDFFEAYRSNDYFTRYAHGFPFEVAAETGLVVAGLLLGFLAATLPRAARTALRSGDTRARAVSAAALVLWIHAALDIDWRSPANVVLAFVLLAIASPAEKSAETLKDRVGG